MVYKGITKTRTTERKIFMLIASAILLYLEITRKQYFYVPFTVLLILAIFHQKEHIVSEDGVDIKYSVMGITTVNRWEWKEITAVQPDYIKERPNAKLLFQKGSTLRSFLFTPEDCQAVVKLAARMNPDMFVDDYTEEEQEEMEKEKLHRQEKIRAQRAQAKRKKK